MMKYLLSTLLGVFLVLPSCKKDSINDQLGIPFVNVSRYIFLSDPNFIGLNAVGGFAYLDGGSKGIIVYHRAFDEYVAFDRHCTWKTQDNCQVVNDTNTTVILNCVCCESKFSLVDGTVLNGPAFNGLLQYNAQISSPGTLHIYNQ
jgi:nitrite reductase/ring-hydroxylating ferredoxin subunit